MSTTVQAPDRQAIEDIVQLYVEGAGKGDAEKLWQAFHEDARMFGSVGGQRVDIPIAQMIEMSVAGPMDMAGTYAASVIAVDQVGDAATARLDESGCWGTASFVDFFSLSRFADGWKIVNKTFAHTGGEVPMPS
jgi:Putative lumazine-binding